MLLGTLGGKSLNSHLTGSAGAPGVPVATSGLSSNVRRTLLSFGFHLRWLGQSTVEGAPMPGNPVGGLGGGFFFGSSATVAPAPAAAPPAGEGAGAAGLTGAPRVSMPDRVPPVGVVVGILSVSNGLPVGTSTSKSAGANAPARPAASRSPRNAVVAFIGHLRLGPPLFPIEIMEPRSRSYRGIGKLFAGDRSRAPPRSPRCDWTPILPRPVAGIQNIRRAAAAYQEKKGRVAWEEERCV